MIALMLRLLASEPMAPRADDLRRAHVLSRVMRVADEARSELGDDLDPGDAGPVARWIDRFRELDGRPLGDGASAPGGTPSTTHLSVIDEEGGCASLTMSYGEGCGRLIGESGIVMNNLLGEEDLFPAGLDQWAPGARIPTMMAPTLLISGDGAMTTMGSGGANRIRSSLVQVISAIVDHGLGPGEAVAAPRVHFEDGVLNAEVGQGERASLRWESLGAREQVNFERYNLFFGGVHIAHRDAAGRLGGAGDPRRGGVCQQS